VILLDTNVWSALNRPRQHPRVADWFSEHESEAWLSIIAIAEIRIGIENPAAGPKRDMLTQWLTDLETRYAERILSFDQPAAHLFGQMAAQKKLQKQETKLLDLQLAAQALAHDCRIATRNVRDFEWTGVKLINPWEQ
jgi:predicted nucleic acid-binding protein